MSMVPDLLRRHRGPLMAAGALGALASAANVALLAYLNDRVTSAAPGAGVGWLPVFLAGVGVMLALLMAGNRVLAGVSARVVAGLRADLTAALLAMRHDDFQRAGRGAMTAVLTDDVDNLSEGLSIAPQFLLHAVTVLGCCVYLAWLSPSAFLCFAATVAAGVTLAVVFSRRGSQAYEGYRRLKSAYYQHLQTLFDGSRDLATHRQRRRHFREREMAPALARLRVSQLGYDMSWHLSETWMRALLMIALGVTLGTIQALHAGSQALTVSYVVGITFLAGSVEFVVNTQAALWKAATSARTIGALSLRLTASCVTADDTRATGSIAATGAERGLSFVDEVRAKEAPPPPAFPDWRQIHFHEIRYHADAADPEAFVLGPVTLTLRRGEVLFLVGGNGSGKSTFARVMNGLVERSGGGILVDGIPIPAQAPMAYRDLFSTLYADQHVFEAPIDADGEPPDPSRVADALERLGLSRRVSLREDGRWSDIALSQGQRKRLALIQAWLDERPVVILDEWAAEQDPEFRAHFYEHLLPEMRRQGHTLVVVSHDDRYFHLADRVCQFESGVLQPSPVLANAANAVPAFPPATSPAPVRPAPAAAVAPAPATTPGADKAPSAP